MTEINVRDDFGAVGDGSTDDTSAFINAFNAIPETGGRITIPAGEYILTQQLDIHNKAITIKGSGFGVTKLVWQAGDNGIVVTQDETDDGDAEKTRIYNLTLRDLSLIQEQDLSGGPQESGCALKVVYIAPSNREKLNCIVENVEIRGRDQFAFAHCWNNGVYFHNVINSMIRNASIDSRERGAMNNGIYFLGDPEVTPVECHIADCLIFGSQYGIQFDGHYEGIYITKCNLLHNTKAAIRATTSPDVVKPSFQIRGCQVEYFLNGFEISGLSGVMISDNFLFVSPGSASEIDNDTSVGIGVNGDSYQVFMANNIVHNAVGSTEGKQYRAVVLGDTRRCVISNNIINEPGNTEFSTGIWFRPGTEKCAAYDNVVSNSRDAYVDDPSNPSNVIRYDPILSD